MNSIIVSDEILFIQDYYKYLFVYLFILILYSFFRDLKGFNAVMFKFVDFITICFITYISYLIGNRPLTVGTDTLTYSYLYSYAGIDMALDNNGDLLFYFLQGVFQMFNFSFEDFMFFCALIYMLCSYFAFKKIFKRNVFYTYAIFLISPYFMLFGINGVRNGMAASLFLLAIGYLVENKANNDKRKAFVIMILSMSIHLALLGPFLLILLKRFFKNTLVLFVFWLLAVVFLILNINILSYIIPAIPYIGARFGNYITMYTSNYDLSSFFIFGVPPILFGAYIILNNKCKEIFYISLFNIYLFLHIFYVLLLKTQFAVRIGYMSEFMMILILCMPILLYRKSYYRFFYTKWVIIVLIIFSLKAYKVLSI